MINILELNDLYLARLREWQQREPDLTFTFRKSNYAGRLSEGFWFYGKETYLGISFWSGMDWRNRTPNIMLRVRENGEIDLEVNVSDSDRKREFVEQFLIGPLQLVPIGRRYMRSLVTNADEERAVYELELFLETLKPQIDRIIRQESERFFARSENSIEFISKDEFEEAQAKIDQYYDRLKNNIEDDDRLGISKPIKLKEFKIFNYGPIESIQIQDIPFGNQWIFITGQNGTGKSNVLRSLGATLGFGDLRASNNYGNESRSEIELFLPKGRETLKQTTIGNSHVSNKKPMTAGLCMYGPYRLRNTGKVGEAKFKSLFNKANSFKSLFTDTGFLLDLEKQLEIWQRREDTRQYLDKRKYYIRNIVIAVVPGMVDIRFGAENNDREIRYVTRKSINSTEQSFSWNELASGTKSVLSLVADIMLRLYHQQPKVVDPSEFKGIVIIDEIDLHLHPIAQKNLIKALSKSFPDVQFIATTHSPIPLLGAPRNSRIYVMSRVEETLTISRMDDKVMFSKILPNGLLSSPIFGLQNLLPESKEDEEVPYLEESYADIQFYERLEKEVNDFLSNEKQNELLRLFLKPESDATN